MGWTKNDRFQCDYCGLFAKMFDSYTPYGCSSYDPPEPHDPTELCEKCSKELEEKMLKGFKDGARGGDWMKSTAERNAAKACGLVWNNSDFKYEEAWEKKGRGSRYSRYRICA